MNIGEFHNSIYIWGMSKSLLNLHEHVTKLLYPPMLTVYTHYKVFYCGHFLRKKNYSHFMGKTI